MHSEPGEHLFAISLLRESNAESPCVDYEKATGRQLNDGQQEETLRKMLDAGYYLSKVPK
jgi:hypothetical protein